jgi:phasin family protein
MLTVEQIQAANKAQVETLFGLTGSAFSSMEKLVELNMAASKALLAESAVQTQSIMGIKDPQEFLSLQTNALQPMGEKAVSYSREVYDLASAAGAELGKALETQMSQAQKKFMDVVDSTAQNAPAGSETAVALVKSAIAAANNVLETAQKSAKQAVAMAESNFKAAATTTMEAAKPVSKKR